MVTTRSADKRLDASREEDLVLRSRRIGSPRSTASTPSQASKRTAVTSGNTISPRPKRARFEADASAQNEASRVMVNVPPKSTSWDDSPSSDRVTKEFGSKVETNLTPDDKARTNHVDDQATPTPKAAAALETPDQGNETYRTPATSRHRRFDSDEIDDDTIVVSTAPNSNATQGYQTAEEEINDSDNEAPEIQTAKIVPTLPQRKPARTPKTKRPYKAIVSTISGDGDTIEVASSQAGVEPLAPVKAIDSTIVEQNTFEKEATNATGSDFQVSESQEQQATSSFHQLADSTFQTFLSLEEGPSLHPIQPASFSATEIPSGTADYDIESVALSNSTAQDVPSADASAHLGVDTNGHEILNSHRDSSVRNTIDASRIFEIRNPEFTSIPTSVRLPRKTTSSLSGHRRGKMQQKVTGSAGGFKMQTNWSKKRSSFVVS